MNWQPISTCPLEKRVLFWLVAENPGHRPGVFAGERSADEGKLWDGQGYYPVAWASHWMPLPDPPMKPMTLAIGILKLVSWCMLILAFVVWFWIEHLIPSTPFWIGVFAVLLMITEQGGIRGFVRHCLGKD